MWLYLTLLSIFIISLVLYCSFVLRAITAEVSYPLESHFKDLHAQFSKTLNCPCSRVAVKYSDFVSFDITFHEICPSQFIIQR